MLKVVGASTWKTTVASCVLILSLIGAVLLLLIAKIERPGPSSIFCATAFWSSKAGFRVEFWGQKSDLGKVAKGAARACYRDSVEDNGWGFLEVETQADFPDRIQAIAAGMLEGALTWAKIYDHWSK